jgi:glycosyltransferase involved in cell wall biosynthesis
MQRSFSIITTCKGRLEHLKLTLPRMLEQGAAEVIVVDYSCPDGTAAWVGEHFPAARVVAVEGEKGFSLWKARNRGAAIAKGTFLIFCDADVVLATDATKQLAKLLTAHSFGYFKNVVSQQIGRLETALSANQLKGFQVLPAASFVEAGGYDELLSGYAAGGDTDLEDRLRIMKLAPIALGPELIEQVLAHDDHARTRFHEVPAPESYLTGYIYRRLKTSLMSLRKRMDLDAETKEMLHDLARQGALNFLGHKKSTGMKLNIADEPLSMLRMLGLNSRFKMSINVEISNEGRAHPSNVSDGPLAARRRRR